MPEPADKDLYEKVKKFIYMKYPIHSAYRSGLLVKEYKKQFLNRYPERSPYLGKKSSNSGLPRWFAEEWRNQRGEIGYSTFADIYRPTRRVNKGTPITFKELSPERVQRAQKEKFMTGRVKRF